MKKAYNAPELFFEEYELCTTIAGGCGNPIYQDKITSGSYTTCNVEVENMGYVFIDESNNCNIGPDYLEGVCYEAFASYETIFNS